MNSKLDFKTAMQDVLPTTFGYLGIGIAFGIIGQASGLSIFLIGLISLITYAGSAQFVLVSMLLAHAPLASIVLAIFFSEFSHVYHEFICSTLFQKRITT